MTEPASWFPVLEPPGGGHARLAVALAADREADLTPWQAAFACLLLLGMAAVPLAMHAMRPDPVAQAIAHADALVGRDGTVAVPSVQPGVQVYLVVPTVD